MHIVEIWIHKTTHEANPDEGYAHNVDVTGKKKEKKKKNGYYLYNDDDNLFFVLIY